MTRREAQVIYRQCYLPKVTYLLPAATIPPNKLYQTQLRVTTQFLNKMGYSAHFPRVVVYAPIEVGRLGFRHLGYEQGVQHVLQLVKHIRSNTLAGQLYSALIDAYQIKAGRARHILEHTDFILWCPDGWMSTLRQFLHSTNTTICLQNPWTPSPCQVNNQNIMDDVQQELPKENHSAINNIRIYLQITHLSEITDASGTTILPHVLQDGPQQSCSTLQWPHQPRPQAAAWKHWR